LGHDSCQTIGVLGASLTGDKTNNEDVTIMDGLVEESTENYSYCVYSNAVANSKGFLKLVP
jgi:hypothetical protein